MTQLTSVLLVGGSGFLGLHLVQQFHDRYQISKYFTFDPTKITFHKGDLTSESDIKDAIDASKCEVIVHSASPIHGMSQDIYEKVNVVGTKALLKVAKTSPVKALVYTSSAGVIFNGQNVYNADESWPYPEVHMDGYNETKAIAEEAVMSANDSSSLLTVCLRPAGIFGPGDRQLVPGLRTAARLGQSKFQLGDNNNLFDWTYVGNVADAHVLAAQKVLDPKYASQLGGETFFITNDAPTYFWTLARTVWKADGHIDKYNIVLSRPVAIAAGYLSQFFSKLLNKEPGLTAFRAKITCATRYHDITKAKTILGYTPEVSLEEGIKHTLDWIYETHKD
ncbi:CIC11C00000002863 [Sungouiella intermedia]|uniref:Sterol-4-alpha-carboxylate 3-dehydrogenase ERG26, decarboxylating n=1 Tax=Sungouiella intermedia TaxID=45354 RepID=A0A1L0DRT9_9ASCO|nr:CIC11C00000002863 [[Candida] intermedia]